MQLDAQHGADPHHPHHADAHAKQRDQHPGDAPKVHPQEQQEQAQHGPGGQGDIPLAHLGHLRGQDLLAHEIQVVVLVINPGLQIAQPLEQTGVEGGLALLRIGLQGGLVRQLVVGRADFLLDIDQPGRYHDRAGVIGHIASRPHRVDRQPAFEPGKLLRGARPGASQDRLDAESCLGIVIVIDTLGERDNAPGQDPVDREQTLGELVDLFYRSGPIDITLIEIEDAYQHAPLGHQLIDGPQALQEAVVGEIHGPHGIGDQAQLSDLKGKK